LRRDSRESAGVNVVEDFIDKLSSDRMFEERGDLELIGVCLRQGVL
jgi:hypothetical protein